MIKCEVCLMTESLDKDGFATSEIFDQGTIDTITASSMDELYSKLHSKYKKEFLNSLEVYENRLEAVAEDCGSLETWSFYISEVTSVSINPNIVLEFIKTR